MKRFSRREVLRYAGLAAGGVTLAACQPKVVEKIVKETVVVEQEVEKVVKETVVVTEEKIVKETVIAPSKAGLKGELRAFVAAGAPVEPVHELLSASMTGRYPDVSVKFEYIVGDLAEKVYTQAAAGTLPDVIHTADLFVVPFANNAVTLDLKPMAEADPEIDLDDVFPSMLGLGTFGGQVHMFPSALDVVTMYYNKTLFEQVGAELPQENWTWDDFIREGEKFKEFEKDPQGNPMYWILSNGTWNWWATVYPWVVGYGGKIKTDDGTQSTWSDPKTLDGMKAYTSMWTEHKIAQPLGVDVGGDSFQLGRAAVWCHIQGVRPALKANVADKFEWDIQLMPTMPDGKRRTGMGTWGISVFSGSKMKEAAYEYVKYLITPACQKLLAQKGMSVPLLRSVAEDPSWTESVTPPPQNLMAYVNGADDAVLPIVDYPADCGSFYTGMVNQAYVAALEAVIRGEKGAEEAFAECDSTIQRCLDENL